MPHYQFQSEYPLKQLFCRIGVLNNSKNSSYLLYIHRYLHIPNHLQNQPRSIRLFLILTQEFLPRKFSFIRRYLWLRLISAPFAPLYLYRIEYRMILSDSYGIYNKQLRTANHSAQMRLVKRVSFSKIPY